MSKGSTPPPPDYKAAAEATADGNLKAAQYAAQANRVDQYTPWGSSTWSHVDNGPTFDQAGYDAAVAKYNDQMKSYQNYQTAEANKNYFGSEGGGSPIISYMDAPKEVNKDDFNLMPSQSWSQTTTLDPKLQTALDSQMDIDTSRSQYAKDLLGQVQAAYKDPFNAPKLNDYTKDVQGIDQTLHQASDYTKNVPGLDYNAPQLSQYTNGVPGLDYNTPEAAGYFKDVQAVNQNAPTLDTEARKKYEQAAFNSADTMLSRTYGRDEQSLRDSLALQGLNPMSQASGQATGSFYDSKNAAYNQLANQSILTGNQMANADYASQLAGYNATNAARGQAFNQANTGFGNALQQYAAKNAVAQQGQTNALNNYGAALQGYSTQNATRQQGFNNGIASMAADTQAQTTANAARNQAYANALNKWQSQYTAAQTERDQPLNTMNALLTGQQVSMPQFPGYAMQATTQGPDMLAATNQQYSALIGANNAQNAASAQTTGSAMGAIGAVAAAFL